MANERQADTRAVPLVKWCGGKRQLLPELLKRVPKSFGVYHEPFLGGGAMFFALRPAKAALSDANPELVIAYRAVRGKVKQVIKLLLELQAKHSKGQYLRIRKQKWWLLDSVEVAARLIYLNKTCFNGIFRLNRKGEFNVPMGRYPKTHVICDDDNLRACSRALQGVSIEHLDFRQAIAKAERGDFIYADPPYVPVSSTANFTSYTDKGFGLGDQRDLVELARQLKRRGVKVLLSNAGTEAVRDLYQGFSIDVVEARRSVNCDGGARGKVMEFLIT